MSKILKELAETVNFRLICGSLETEITSVESNSRNISDGSLFVAIKGFTSDGHNFLDQCAALGAKCFAVEKERSGDGLSDEELKERFEDRGITVVEIEDTKKGLALLMSAFFDHPEKKLRFVGVTGTKGKTTTTFMLHSILNSSGVSAGLIGTVCNCIGSEKFASTHTTPDAYELFGLLNKMTERNFDSCVMEISSQGLKLDRVYGIDYEVACFTNFYRDHIGGNEHPTMEDYLGSKLKIFDTAKNAVINRQTDKFEAVYEYASKKCKVFTYGIDDVSDVRASGLVETEIDGQVGTEFTLESPWYSGKIFMPLPGAFNVYNALCCISVCGIYGIDFEVIKNCILNFSVPGRMQPIRNKLGFQVLVDYAHNEASLESALVALRDYTKGKLISVFGCGGNRSRERRFGMGEISGKLADYTIITSDNPRREEPEAIIADIKTGMDKTDGAYEIVVDRKSAISKAISIANKGDIILIAGKGHEDYQEINGVKYPFDDSIVAAEEIKKLEGTVS